MKIGIIGDTHRQYKYIDKALTYLSECELIFHTGDNFEDSIYINKAIGVDVIGIRGNCDIQKNIEDEISIDINGYKILVCHGHLYNVKNTMQDIKNKSKIENIDIFIFGHNHTYTNIIDGNRVYLNPGSLYRPNGQRSFIIMDLDENIKITKMALDLDGDFIRA